MTSNQINKLAGIVGTENVIIDPAALKGYASASGFVSGHEPCCIVRVKDAKQAEAVVKLANEDKLRLLPVSSAAGKHLHGGSVPAVSDTVILDLSGMKTIYDADRLFRIVVIDPGVTYEELIPALAEKGLMIDMPLAPKAGKSVIASLVETEPRLNSNVAWSVLDPLRCVEVVWGDGNRMRTGEAAGLPLNLSTADAVKFSHEEKHGWLISPNGPDTIDYFRLISGAQGTMGVATWASVKCAILPDIMEMYLLGTPKLDAGIEFMYGMAHIRCGDGVFLLNGYNLASLMAADCAEAEKLTAALPKWIVCAVAASRPPVPEMRAAAQREGIAISADKAGLTPVRELCGIKADDVMKKAFSPCAPGKYWQDTSRGASASILFLTTMDRVPDFVAVMEKAALGRGYKPGQFGIYVQPKHQGVSCRVEFSIPYNPADEADTLNAKTLFDEASRLLFDAGAFYSRPYGAWAQLQLPEGKGSTERLKKLKEMFDPNNVLGLGRLSDWAAGKC